MWYRGERFWVEYAPTTWDKGCNVRITDRAVHPNPEVRSGTDLCYVDEKGVGHGNVVSFCVHADVLDLAPANRNIYGRQPSQADIARRERVATGQRDVGDEVATLLREAGGVDGCYKAAAKFLGVGEPELRQKYGHLNPGQQRMNLGNRMRAYAKKRHV